MVLTRRELNALRRLLDRPVITPGDIAALGRARLEAAPGLGAKGLANVLAWLTDNHCSLPETAKLTTPTVTPSRSLSRDGARDDHLLSHWGWQRETYFHYPKETTHEDR